MNDNTSDIQPHRVVIIVPVYRNLVATRNCIESLMASDLPEHSAIIVIDDNSPEDAVSAYCEELTKRFGIQLLVNDENLGFVRAVNKGFIEAGDADIILLNSDTVVANDWAQRLQACAYREDSIGTVTPFSNNGTICSYPVFLTSNSLPKQWDTREMDRAFQSANTGSHYEIPTAVGFCMYIKRFCLNATGDFDEESFGQGYGEECDFSLRASAKGWKHVIAADVFVYHEGAASFASESTERKRRADAIMSILHPNYHALIGDFIARDPLYFLRKNVDAVRLNEKPADAINILEEHFCYAKSILERARNEQEQRQRLEILLADVREKFSETDSALSDAQALVTGLNSDLKQLQVQSRDLKKLHAQSCDTIQQMEKSRSWRYTAWMRKK
ncbi:MAG: glycosyltransferase family 2 protein [Halioglobus sp.]|nr:glycosyltransferase family 2 protein [Halioglobus sp.]